MRKWDLSGFYTEIRYVDMKIRFDARLRKVSHVEIYLWALQDFYLFQFSQ